MFVSVAETFDPDRGSRFSAVEHLKPLISEHALMLEFKGREPVRVDNFGRYVFCTNHLDGLKIDANERRFYVVDMGDAKPLPDAFYGKLAALIDTEEGLAAIAALLASRRDACIEARAPEGDMGALQDAFIADWAADLTARYEGQTVFITAADVRHYAGIQSGSQLSGLAVKKAMVEAGWHQKRSGGVRYFANHGEASFANDLVCDPLG